MLSLTGSVATLSAKPLENESDHEWTVSEDWEARTRLANGIFQVQKTRIHGNQCIVGYGRCGGLPRVEGGMDL